MRRHGRVCGVLFQLYPLTVPLDAFTSHARICDWTPTQLSILRISCTARSRTRGTALGWASSGSVRFGSALAATPSASHRALALCRVCVSKPPLHWSAKPGRGQPDRRKPPRVGGPIQHDFLGAVGIFFLVFAPVFIGISQEPK